MGDGKTVPAGAVPLATCAKANQYECQSFAKTESTGHELANAVNALLDNARPLPFKTITVRKQEFYSRATNLGFRALIAQGQLGWKPMQTYNCTGKPFTDANCVNAGPETIADPVLTPAMGAPASVSKGDVLKTRVMHVSFGDVGMLFVPGEVPSELVVGLPGDFNTAPDTKYFHGAANDHAVGDKYVIPGHYLSLVDEPLTFVVGLGTDELGYFVPASDYRLQCHALSLPGAGRQLRGPGGPRCDRVSNLGWWPHLPESVRRSGIPGDLTAGCASGQGDLLLRAIRGFSRSRSRPDTMKKPMPPDGTWWTICGRPPSSFLQKSKSDTAGPERP